MDQFRNAFPRKKNKIQTLPSWGYVQIASDQSMTEIETEQLADESLDEILQQYTLKSNPILINNCNLDQIEEEKPGDQEEVQSLAHQQQQQVEQTAEQPPIQLESTEEQKTLQAEAQALVQQESQEEQSNGQAVAEPAVLQLLQDEQQAEQEEVQPLIKQESSQIDSNQQVQNQQDENQINQPEQFQQDVLESNLQQNGPQENQSQQPDLKENADQIISEEQQQKDVQNLKDQYKQKVEQALQDMISENIKFKKQILEMSNQQQDNKDDFPYFKNFGIEIQQLLKKNETPGNNDKNTPLIKLNESDYEKLFELQEQIDKVQISIDKAQISKQDKQLISNLNKIKQIMYKDYLNTLNFESDNDKYQFLILDLLNIYWNSLNENKIDKKNDQDNNQIKSQKQDPSSSIPIPVEQQDFINQPEEQKNENKDQIQQDSKEQNNEGNGEIQQKSNEKYLLQEKNTETIENDFKILIQLYKNKYKDQQNDNKMLGYLSSLNENQLNDKYIVSQIVKNNNNGEIYLIEYQVFQTSEHAFVLKQVKLLKKYGITIELAKIDYFPYEYYRFISQKCNSVIINEDSIFFLQQENKQEKQIINLYQKKLRNKFTETKGQEKQVEKFICSKELDQEDELNGWDLDFMHSFEDKIQKENYLEQKFIVASSSKSIRIFSLKNLEINQIIKINQGNYYLNYSFVFKENELYTFYVLDFLNDNIYTITRKEIDKQQDYDVEKQEINDFQIIHGEYFYCMRTNQQIEILRYEIMKSKDNIHSFYQYYYLEAASNCLRLIHPFNQLSKQKDAITEEIIKGSNPQFDFSQNDPKLYRYSQNQLQISTFDDFDDLKKINKDIIFEQVYKILQIENMLIFRSNQRTIISFDTEYEIENHSNKNQETKYSFQDEICNAYNVFDGDCMFYTNQNYVSTNNKCFTQLKDNEKKSFQFKDNYLLIDASQFDSTEQEQNQEIFFLLKLEENINEKQDSTSVKDQQKNQSNLKVLKYHCGKEKFVIFFELEQEITNNNQETFKQSQTNLDIKKDGIQKKNEQVKIFEQDTQQQIRKNHFMIIMSNKDSKTKIQKLQKNKEPFFGNQKIDFYTYNGQNFLQQSASNYQELKDKLGEVNNQYLFSFENVTDFKNNNQEIILLVIHYYDQSQKIQRSLCYIQLDLEMDNEKFIQKINLYFQYNKNKSIKDKKIKRENELPFKYRIENLFCRTSEWFLQEKNIYFAKFVIGSSHIYDQTHFIELREYQIRLPLRIYQQSQLLDNKQQDIEKFQQLNKYFQEKDDEVVYCPTQIKFLIFKTPYSNEFRSSRENDPEIKHNPIHNHRLLPKFDDQGHVSGYYAMINHFHSELGKKETENEFYYINKPDFNKDAYDLIYQSTNLYEKIEKKDLNEIKKDFRQYDVFDMSNRNKLQTKNQMKNTIFECSLQENDFVYLTSAKYSKKFIEEIDIDNINQTFFLQNLAKQMFITKKDDYFNDFFGEEDKDNVMNFMQPQFKLKGQNNLFNILIGQKEQIEQQQIQPISDISQREQIEQQQIQPLSDISQKMNKSLNENEKLRQLQRLFEELDNKKSLKSYLRNSIYNNMAFNEDLESYLQISYNFEFVCDILERRSILEILFTNEHHSEFKKTINYLIKNKGKHANHRKIIQINLLLLFYQNEVKIYEIFSLDKQLEEIQNEKFEADYFSNIEQLIEYQNIGDETSKVLPEDGFKDNEQWALNISENLNLSEPEIIEHIQLQLNSEYKKKITDNKQQLVKIVFSYIDFTYSFRQLTFGCCLVQLNGDLDQKFKSYIDSYKMIYTESDQIKCTDLMLARMMTIKKGDSQFYDQQTIQEIIDLQYKKTKAYILSLLIIYIFGFYIPYCYNVLSYNLIEQDSHLQIQIRTALYILQGIIQLFFLAISLNEIHMITLKDFLKDTLFAVSGLLQHLLFIAHLVLMMYTNKIDFGTIRISFSLVQIFLNITSMIKILEHIRFDASLQFFVAVFFEVIKELFPFIILFILFALFFCFVIIIMLGGIQNSEDYPDVPTLIQAFFQVFRTQIGDIQIVQYGKWDEQQKQEHPYAYYIAIIVIWITWFLNIIIMQIMMLNIVIAQVGQIFDKVMSRGEAKTHEELATLNLKIFQMQKIFNRKETDFDAFIIQRPLQSIGDGDTDKQISTITSRIKKNTQALLNKTQKQILLEIEKNQNSNNEKMEKEMQKHSDNQDIQLKTLKEELKSLQTDQKSLETNIQNKFDSIYNILIVLQPKKVEKAIEEEVKPVEESEAVKEDLDQ